MENPVTWTDEWQVFLVAAQLGVLLLAAVVAGWQVLEARRLRLERNRPFVVVDFNLDLAKGYLIYFEVVNPGTSLARDEAEVHDFGTDYEAAQEAYAGLEQENGIETSFDVVLLSADSLETIEQTHSSYFSDRSNSLQKLLSG